MKALVFTGTGDPREVVQIDEMTLPVPKDNEIIIDIKARPVNPADLMFIKGQYRRKPAFPQIAGLDGAGLVAACGPLVSAVKPGDHVVFRQPGTWAEQIILAENMVTVVPKELSFEIACQLPLNGLTAAALLRESRVTAGEFLLLDAAGSFVSSLIIQLAVQKGIRVIGIVRDAWVTDGVRKAGAESVFLQSDPELADKILARTGEKKVSCFLDAVGGSTLSSVIPLIAPFGRIILYGNLNAGEPASFTNASIIYNNLSMQGFGIDSWLAGIPAEELNSVYNSLFDMLLSGTLVFPENDCVRLDEIVFTEQANKMVIVS